MSSPQASQEKRYVYKTTLRDVCGLTPAMIVQLGEPDLRVPNPHYRSGPEASLYSIERVEAWIEEHKAEVDRARALRVVRSKRGKDVAQARSEKLLRWAHEADIHVRPLSRNVREEAESYYATSGRGEGCVGVGWGGLVAYVRHNRTNYHGLLANLEGQPGAEEAYRVVKQRVNEAAELALSDALLGDHEALVSEEERLAWEAL